MTPKRILLFCFVHVGSKEYTIVKLHCIKKMWDINYYK